MTDDNIRFKAVLIVLVTVAIISLVLVSINVHHTIDVEPRGESTLSFDVEGNGFGAEVNARITESETERIDRIHLVNENGKVVEKETLETGATAVTLMQVVEGNEYTAVAIDDGEIVERRSFIVKKHWPWEGGLI